MSSVSSQVGGGVLGAASNRENPGKGALGGAIGAVSAVMMLENLPKSMRVQRKADVSRAVGTHHEEYQNQSLQYMRKHKLMTVNLELTWDILLILLREMDLS